MQVSRGGTNLLQTHVAAQSRIKAISSNCGVRIEHSRCCWLEGAKPNIVVTKRDVTTRIFTYNGGLMWFTETVQIVPKTRKTLQTHFSITSWFFLIFLRFFWAASLLKEKLKSSWESTIKISAETDNRAKSYARFTEGTSSYVLGRHTRWRWPYMNNFFAMKPSSPEPKVLRTTISTILA